MDNSGRHSLVSSGAQMTSLSTSVQAVVLVPPTASLTDDKHFPSKQKSPVSRSTPVCGGPQPQAPWPEGEALTVQDARGIQRPEKPQEPEEAEEREEPDENEYPEEHAPGA